MKIEGIKSKKQLEESSQEYQEALEKDLNDLIDRAKTILTGALVVGAGFWVAYKIFKAVYGEKEPQYSEHDHDHTESEPSVFSIVKHTIMKELAMFLLGIIKEKVIEYLQEIAIDDEEGS